MSTPEKLHIVANNEFPGLNVNTASKAEIVRYACQQFNGVPETGRVKQWLKDHDFDISDSTIYNAHRAWRQEYDLINTIDIPKVTAVPDIKEEKEDESKDVVIEEPETDTSNDEPTEEKKVKKPHNPWPVWLMILPAFVAIWSGWVGLGELCGFGVVQPFPGISDFQINTAITLPIGVEAYAGYALHAWLSGRIQTASTQKYAMWSAIFSLVIGALGQVAYHLMESNGIDRAPWPIVILVSCLPILVVGMGVSLAHLISKERD